MRNLAMSGSCARQSPYVFLDGGGLLPVSQFKARSVNVGLLF